MTPRFNVSDFLALVNQTLEMAFGFVEIEGEVAEFKINHQKYVFFNLKDSDGAVGCFMTVWQLRMPIEDGMKVVVRAAPKVTAWGKFSLTVQDIRPVGEGNLRRSFELLRKKLAGEGLFDEARKRSLPKYPRRVAVISSIEAAGYTDFMKIARERWGGVTFLVANIKVQGDGAADQAVRALEYFNQLTELPEVIVILRGGGSADDLASFNDELLVRAVAASRVAVLTGIGHEVDESLCDLVADVRASTPSNAAELLFPDRQAIISQLKLQLQGAVSAVNRGIDSWQVRVTDLRQRALMVWRGRIEELLRETALKKDLITEYNPEVVLQRGYAMVEGKQKVGNVVKITTKSNIMKARIEYHEKRHDS